MARVWAIAAWMRQSCALRWSVWRGRLGFDAPVLARNHPWLVPPHLAERHAPRGRGTNREFVLALGTTHHLGHRFTQAQQQMTRPADATMAIMETANGSST